MALKKNSKMEEKIPFSLLYENMQAILDKPMLYSVEITRFSAGGLGACAYSQPITIAELAIKYTGRK